MMVHSGSPLAEAAWASAAYSVPATSARAPSKTSGLVRRIATRRAALSPPWSSGRKTICQASNGPKTRLAARYSHQRPSAVSAENSAADDCGWVTPTAPATVPKTSVYAPLSEWPSSAESVRQATV